jgi:hypothetical protein
LETNRLYLTIAPPLACFQLHSKVNRKVGKEKAVSNGHDIVGEMNSTYVRSKTHLNVTRSPAVPTGVPFDCGGAALRTIDTGSLVEGVVPARAGVLGPRAATGVPSVRSEQNHTCKPFKLLETLHDFFLERETPRWHTRFKHTRLRSSSDRKTYSFIPRLLERQRRKIQRSSDRCILIITMWTKIIYGVR